MTCKELEDKWGEYAAGGCTLEDRERIERHLQDCPSCQRKLDEELTKQEASRESGPVWPGGPEDYGTADKERRWMTVAKWKHRFFTALSVLGMFLGLWSICAMMTAAFYGIGGEASRAQLAPKVVRTVTEMTMPGVLVRSGGISIQSFFTLEFRYDMTRTVGMREKPIGELQGRMLFNRLSAGRKWAGGSYNTSLYFMHPGYFDRQDAESQRMLLAESDRVREALRKLPEGTVAELAVSFDRVSPVDRVYELLDGYDINILWYAMDTGLEVQDRRPYVSAGDGLWGIGEFQSLDFVDGPMLVRGEGSTRELAFERALAFTLEHRKWAEQYLGKLQLQERFDYVKRNGARTYGVLVTGPTKELLRLSERNEIRSVALGEVDWWNWYSPGKNATMKG